MSEAAMSPTATYLLRVAAEEIEQLESGNLLQFPHIARFIARPSTRFVMSHIQNFCWTTQRAFGRIRHRPVPSEAKLPRRFMPDPPGCAALRGAPRIWIDVTNTHRTSFGGGIGRVATRLAKAAAETGLALPVVMEEGRVRPYFREPDGPSELQFTPDVTYVVIDSFWEQLDEYLAVFSRAKVAGTRIVTCIHDVIPLYYPSLNRRVFADRFAAAFAEMMKHSDACITVSQHSADRVRDFIDALDLRSGRPLPIASFHLGADGHVDHEPGRVRDEVRALFARPNAFLSVGTLEPRKGYAVTLDAFDALWTRSIDCSLVIIGHPGWLSTGLERRIHTHPEYGRRLHWLSDATDGDLAFAYRHAHCLIQASITEGFGLPVVEANHEGTPVIAADTEVFRELAGGAIDYFRNCDSADLAARVEDAVDRRPTVRRFDIPTWNESLSRMIEAIQGATSEPDCGVPEPMPPAPRARSAARRPYSASRRPRPGRLWTDSLRQC